MQYKEYGRSCEKGRLHQQAAFSSNMLRFPRFCQLHQKPVNVYGVNAPLNDAVAELHKGKEREALFLLAHPYVSFGFHPYRLLLGPFYRISAWASRMRFMYLKAVCYYKRKNVKVFDIFPFVLTFFRNIFP